MFWHVTAFSAFAISLRHQSYTNIGISKKLKSFVEKNMLVTWFTWPKSHRIRPHYRIQKYRKITFFLSFESTKQHYLMYQINIIFHQRLSVLPESRTTYNNHNTQLIQLRNTNYYFTKRIYFCTCYNFVPRLEQW